MKEKKEIVLITGASGLIGNTLTDLLIQKGFAVRTLGRKKSNRKDIESYTWNWEANYIDKEAVLNADYIIHLAGAGVVDKRWTKQRKDILVNSRVKTANLLFKAVNESKNRPKAVLSASGINYYGTITSEKIYFETDPPGTDFLAYCTQEWEKAIDQFELLCNTVKLRLGMVLAKTGGGLPAIVTPIKWRVGAALGSGKQHLPWIHIDDVCAMFYYCLTSGNNGTYNAIAPHHVNNIEFTKTAAGLLNRKIILPNVPGFILKIILGERANLILEGCKSNSDKIVSTGFQFMYNNLPAALNNLLSES